MNTHLECIQDALILVYNLDLRAKSQTPVLILNLEHNTP